MVRSFGGSQIVGVQSAVRIKNLGKAQLHVRSRRSLNSNSWHTRKILSEIEDVGSRSRVGSRFGWQGLLRANWLEVLPNDLGFVRLNHVRVLPIAVHKFGSVPSGLHFPRVVGFAVVDFGEKDR